MQHVAKWKTSLREGEGHSTFCCLSLLFKELVPLPFIVLSIQGIYCPYYSRHLLSLLFKAFIVLTIQGIYCPYY